MPRAKIAKMSARSMIAPRSSRRSLRSLIALLRLVFAAVVGGALIGQRYFGGDRDDRCRATRQTLQRARRFGELKARLVRRLRLGEKSHESRGRFRTDQRDQRTTDHRSYDGDGAVIEVR